MTGNKAPKILTSLTAALAAVGLMFTGLAPASALWHNAKPASNGSINYINLGDSYSAGFGSGSIRPGPIANCLQATGRSHVTEIAAMPGVKLQADFACAGYNAQQVGMVAAGLAGPLAEADLVTLSLGGNNLQWGQTVAACSSLGNAAGCEQLVAAGYAALPEVEAQVHQTLQLLDSLTPGTVLALGYPRLLTPSAGDQALITAKNARILNKLGDTLNRTLRTATKTTGAKFVPVLGPFNNHGVGATDSWIYFNQTDPLDPFNMHPTTSGYLQGYFPAVRNHIHSVQLSR